MIVIPFNNNYKWKLNLLKFRLPLSAQYFTTLAFNSSEPEHHFATAKLKGLSYAIKYLFQTITRYKFCKIFCYKNCYYLTANYDYEILYTRAIFGTIWLNTYILVEEAYKPCMHERLKTEKSYNLPPYIY